MVLTPAKDIWEDLYTISKLLNHTTVNMTKRYAHLRDSALRDATQVMNGVFEVN